MGSDPTIGLLSLHRTREHAADELLLTDDEDRDRRDDDHHNAGNHQGDGLGIDAVEHADTDLDGPHAVRAGDEQRPHVHVPGIDEGVDSHRADRGFRERNQDLHDEAQVAAAVELRGLIE